MAVASSSSTNGAVEESEDGLLFHPPPDLICPITQSLFIDPVVNSVGQTYERTAFEKYLELAAEKNDPVTRQPVDEHVLTSIYAVKTRASDYREHTARKCVELASQAGVALAMKYLKRAAELCSETDLQIPGLGRGTVSRILRKSNENGYSTTILMSFAEDLLKDGQRDRAADVYSSILKYCCPFHLHDCYLLRCCIECWAGHFSDSADEVVSLQKLLEFVEEQKAFSWGDIVDVMQHSCVDEHLIICFCEALISKNDPDLSLWKMQKEVMMRYIQMQCDMLHREQGAAQKSLQMLLEWKERSSRSRGVKTKLAVPLSVLKEHRKPFFMKKKFIASMIIGFLELTSGGHWFTRITKTAGILYLINSQ